MDSYDLSKQILDMLRELSVEIYDGIEHVYINAIDLDMHKLVLVDKIVEIAEAYRKINNQTKGIL